MLLSHWSRGMADEPCRKGRLLQDCLFMKIHPFPIRWVKSVVLMLGGGAMGGCRVGWVQYCMAGAGQPLLHAPLLGVGLDTPDVAGCRCGREVLECVGREQLEGAWLHSVEFHRRGLGRVLLALLEPRQGAAMFWIGKELRGEKKPMDCQHSGEQLASLEMHVVGQGHTWKGRERSLWGQSLLWLHSRTRLCLPRLSVLVCKH